MPFKRKWNFRRGNVRLYIAIAICCLLISIALNLLSREGNEGVEEADLVSSISSGQIDPERLREAYGNDIESYLSETGGNIYEGIKGSPDIERLRQAYRYGLDTADLEKIKKAYREYSKGSQDPRTMGDYPGKDEKK